MKKLAVMLVILVTGLVCAWVLIPGESKTKTRFLTIGTGGVTGVYYPTGAAIARIINRRSADYNIRCAVESTAGSVFNVNAVLQGKLDFGIVQSDRQYQAVHGLAEWRELGPQKNLRAVFAIHPETHFLCVRADSGINEVRDLKGKAVGVGNAGSGQRQNFIDILAEYNMTHRDLERAEGAKIEESVKLFLDGRLDAFIYTVGSPNALLKEASAAKPKLRFIPFDPAKIRSLMDKYPYYVPARIAMEFYPGAANKTEFVSTFAVKATFVTRVDLPEELVYRITKEFFSNFEEFKTMHPAFKHLSKKMMLQGLSAPIHPGAMRYYREAGLK